MAPPLDADGGPAPENRTVNPTDLVVEAIGAEESVLLPWVAMWQARVQGRLGRSLRYRWVVLAITLAGLFTVGFTITILSASIPRIADELHSTKSTITWVITAPILAFGIVGPAVGKIGDVHGHRRVYVAGLFTAGVFALGVAAAPNAATLIVFRTLSAGAGAATGPSAMAMINRVFRPEERVKALGWWSLVSAGAPVLGVVAGGPIVEQFGWRWIFVFQSPLCVLGALLAILALPETAKQVATRFDAAGAVTLAASVTALLVAVNRGGVWGWTSPRIGLLVVVSIVVAVAFVRIELRADAPLLPMRYMRRRNFVLPIAHQTLSNFSYMGGFILAPLLLDEIKGYDESHIGWLLITRPTTVAVVSPLAGFLTVRFGERLSALAGTVALGAAMVVLSTVAMSTSDAVIALGLGLSGAGIGLALPPMTSAVANSVDERDLGIAGATQQLMTQVSAAMGMQVLQAVHDSAGADGGRAGYQRAFLTSAMVALAAGVFVFGVRNRPRVDAA